MLRRILSMAVLSLLAPHASAQYTTGSKTNTEVEQKIWGLLNEKDRVFVSLPEKSFMELGTGFDLPDGGAAASAIATAAPGGAFDPRELEKLDPKKVGYKAKWVVERYKRYNLEWDITGLQLTSENPDAKKYPWLVIMNGGAANFYEFYVDLKNRPGWAQYLAQKLNVLIVTIPGNFKYGGWTQPIPDPDRQPAYVLDRQLPLEESLIRNAIYTNALVLQGVKQIVLKATTGEVILVGHSTSGEIEALANEDPELHARMKGRFLGWGSGGPARLGGQRLGGMGAQPAIGPAAPREVGDLTKLARRDVASYSHGYSGFLNPLYEPGDGMKEIAAKWLEAEARRRPQFKQPLQDLEHGGGLPIKVEIEQQLRDLLKKSRNPWGISEEDVDKDLFIADFARMDGYTKMVWTCAHFDRNHWLPEEPTKAYEVYVVNKYREVNPTIPIRLMVWDPPMTHYGHLELPKQLAAAEYSTIRWLIQP